jgi:hypothetical protein
VLRRPAEITRETGQSEPADRHMSGKRVNEGTTWTVPKRNKGVDEMSAPLLSLTHSYLQPEHEAQHSADGQHPCAAFAVPATPSAITAIHNTTFSVFIVFSLEVERVVEADE